MRRRLKCRRLMTHLRELQGRFEILVGLDILTLGEGFDRPPGVWERMRAIGNRMDRVRVRLNRKFAREQAECARMDRAAWDWPISWPLCHHD